MVYIYMIDDQKLLKMTIMLGIHTHTHIFLSIIHYIALEIIRLSTADDNDDDDITLNSGVLLSVFFVLICCEKKLAHFYAKNKKTKNLQNRIRCITNSIYILFIFTNMTDIYQRRNKKNKTEKKIDIRNRHSILVLYGWT